MNLVPPDEPVMDLRPMAYVLNINGRMARMNWAANIRGDYWLMGVTWLDCLFHGLWVIRVDKDGNFIPIEDACTSRSDCPWVTDCYESGRRTCTGCDREVDSS